MTDKENDEIVNEQGEDALSPNARLLESPYSGENKRKRCLKLANAPDIPASSSAKRPKAASEDYTTIAHSGVHATMMDGLDLANGVRFELARLITAGQISYTDITTERLIALQGSNKDMVPRILEVLKPGTHKVDAHSHLYADEQAATSPWAELDLEEAALAVGPDEGLGNNDRLPGWYGGKAEFRARLAKNEDAGHSEPYKIFLEPCTLGPSSRFTRQFGSWSFIRVKIPQTLLHDTDGHLHTWFKKRFVLWGRVYRACFAKSDNVFLYWTNETVDGGATVPGRLSFSEFIFGHNPLEANADQLMTKWSARTALGFSTSVPGPLLTRDNIVEIPDIMSAENSEMTDGCGLSTKNVHRVILNLLGLHDIPTAVQFRLAGCKGMLAIRDDDEGNADAIKVWVRNSQIKIAYPAGLPLSKAQLTIDLLRTSHLSTPSRISSEIIINLAENGVRSAVFVQLLRTSINEIVKGLTTWDGPGAMLNLWSAVERAGGVLAGRRAREAVGEARVKGYRSRSSEEDELEEDEDGDDDGEGILGALNASGHAQRSVAWWADQVSGCPSTLEDTVMVLLDSGFTPQTSPVLREKLKEVVKKTIKNRMQKLRFELPQSCTAFAIPDPFGVLEEEQIHIKSSKRNLHMADGLLSDMVVGEVLVGRTPCKLPTDVRKVTAVDHPALRNYVDVVVFSTKGKRRLIDFLAGGDYDGDKVLAMWDPQIVAQFKNAPEKYSLEPGGLDYAFTRDTEKGTDFMSRVSVLSESRKIVALQQYLLGELLSPSLVGKYSTWHSNAIYQLGYGHPRTCKLAAKFGRVMDAAKSGYRIKRQTFAADKQEYNHPKGPLWMSKTKKSNTEDKDKAKFDESNMDFLQRIMDSPFVQNRTFIMDKLHAAAEKEKSRLLGDLESVFAPLCHTPDVDLVAPWTSAVTWAEEKSATPEFKKMKMKDLGMIAAHVHIMYRKHKALMRSRKGFTDLPIEKRQDALRQLSKEFYSQPNISELQTIPDEATLNRYRASYAYQYDAQENLKDGEQGWTRFPWNVALRELCAIKAAALGPYKVVTQGFYDRFKLVKADGGISPYIPHQSVVTSKSQTTLTSPHFLSPRPPSPAPANCPFLSLLFLFTIIDNGLYQVEPAAAGPSEPKGFNEMSTTRPQIPPTNLKERIAALEQRNAANRPTSPTGSVSSGVGGNVPHAAGFRDKIAKFEKKGGVPVPRGRFGLGAPPTVEGPRKQGELYGNRIPAPVRHVSAGIVPTLNGNGAVSGDLSTSSARLERRSISLSNFDTEYGDEHSRSPSPSFQTALKSADTLLSPTSSPELSSSTPQPTTVIPSMPTIVRGTSFQKAMELAKNAENAKFTSSEYAALRSQTQSPEVEKHASADTADLGQSTPVILLSPEDTPSYVLHSSPTLDSTTPSFMSDASAPSDTIATNSPTVESQEKNFEQSADAAPSPKPESPAGKDDESYATISSQDVKDADPNTRSPTDDGYSSPRGTSSPKPDLPSSVELPATPLSDDLGSNTSLTPSKRAPLTVESDLTMDALMSPLSSGNVSATTLADALTDFFKPETLEARSPAGTATPPSLPTPEPLSPIAKLAYDTTELSIAVSDETSLLSPTDSAVSPPLTPGSTAEISSATRVTPTTGRGVPLFLPSNAPSQARKSDFVYFPPTPEAASTQFPESTAAKVEETKPKFRTVVHEKVLETAPGPKEQLKVPETPQTQRFKRTNGAEPPPSPGQGELAALWYEAALLESSLEQGELPAEVPAQSPITDVKNHGEADAKAMQEKEKVASNGVQNKRSQTVDETTTAKLKHTFLVPLSRAKTSHRKEVSASATVESFARPPVPDAAVRPKSSFVSDPSKPLPRPVTPENDKHLSPHNTPSKSPKQRFGSFRRLGSIGMSRPSTMYSTRHSQSGSSEMSAEDSPTVTTPVDHDNDFGHSRASTTSEFGQLSAKVSTPSLSSKKSVSSVSRATSFAGKMWSRARTRSNGSALSSNNDASDDMPRLQSPLPELPTIQLPHLPHFDAPPPVDKDVIHPPHRAASLKHPMNLPPIPSEFVLPVPMTGSSAFFSTNSADVSGDSLMLPDSSYSTRPSSWASFASTAGSSLPQSPLFDESFINSFPSVPETTTLGFDSFRTGQSLGRNASMLTTVKERPSVDAGPLSASPKGTTSDFNNSSRSTTPTPR